MPGRDRGKRNKHGGRTGNPLLLILPSVKYTNLAFVYDSTFPTGNMQEATGGI